ncbi:pentatricopeptide repeat-containing protein At5g02830, chloroplastic-like [Vicia villosa]|uniref:pentatricopeptide repeat-containing protein At5g02830, chloroplastic-like n=1 Tax=Vicia villosa TaxID=3911 RepID=UPI00273C477D|nr:pentatricopeptide repeat-containing protein At5g02830, chloroplastic-like [Vicia villosa]
MRDFVILGSSIITPPPNSHPPPSSSSSTPQHRHPILKPHKPSLPKFKPLSSSNTSSTPLQTPLKLKDSGTLDTDSELNPEVLANAVLVGIKDKNVRSVIERLNKAEGLGGISLSEHLDASVIANECCHLVTRGHIEEAVELMEILPRFQLSIAELVEPSHILKRCVLNRKPILAVRYASLLPKAHILFNRIILEFGKSMDLVSALKAYDATRENLKKPNLYICRAIIDACGLCGDFMKSRYLYEDWLNQKITPNIYVFNSLMNVNAHDFSYSLDLYQNMQKLGVKPDVTSYNILLKACCVAGRVDLAQDMYKELKHLESVGQLKLDVFTYSTIIKVFADAKLWQMALKIKRDMLSAGVSLNAVAWSSLINACAHAGLVEQAIQLFEEMMSSGCEPNTRCFNIILNACVEDCQYDRAFRFFHSWKGNKMLVPFDESNNNNSEQGGMHNVTKVPTGISSSHILSFTERFPFAPTTSTYNILLKACGTNYYHAKALFNEMRTVGLSPNQISWSTLIDICGASENVDGVVEILRTMIDSGIKPDVVAYTTAIKVCVESRKFTQALTLYKEMKSYGTLPNMVTYNTLLRARSKYGSLREVQQCLAIYQDMRKAGYKPNDYYLKELIGEWCEGVIQESGEYECEFSYSKKPEKERPRSLLLETIATHLLKRVADILAIDVQGLTKVEARLVILAVLRMIKENYAFGHSVNDDILIIIGATKADEGPSKEILEVQEAIIKLLWNELGLEALPPNDRTKFQNPKLSNLTLKAPADESLPTTTGLHTRRPSALQRLKVTKKSLDRWLQRKVSVK